MPYTVGVLDKSSVDKVSTEKCTSLSAFPSTVLEFGVMHGHPDGGQGWCPNQRSGPFLDPVPIKKKQKNPKLSVGSLDPSPTWLLKEQERQS